MRRSLPGIVAACFALGAVPTLDARAQDVGDRIVAAVPREWPPQYALDDGRPVGFAIDTMDAVAENAGLSVRYRVYESFHETAEALRRREVDVIPNFGIVTEREAYALFTAPTETFVVSIFVRRDTPDIRGAADLVGRQVAVVDINVGEDLVAEMDGVVSRPYPDPRSAFYDLLAGEVDAMVFPRPVLEMMARRAGLSDRIRVVGAPLAEVKRGIGVRSDAPGLHARLDRSVRELRGTERYEAIYRKWYGEPVSFWTVERVAWLAGGLLAILALGFGIWRARTLVRLNRELRERHRIEREMREKEEMLRHAQKHEAIGRLAGGVAHDFNNLLTAVIGYTDILLRRAEDEDVREGLGEIRAAADRGATLSRQLLTLGRREVVQRQQVCVDEVVGEVRALLARLIGEDVALETSLRAGDACVLVDRGQLEQVLMNLAVNARDAMPGVGTLTVRTASSTVDADRVARHPAASAGPYVVIEVRDTGEGMDEETLAHAFDPFFTTKARDRGTGLGLSIVLGIVEQSGGFVEVDSRPGEGTSFRAYLPRVPGVAARRESSGAHARRPPDGSSGETILVVEDEDAVRRTTVRMLRGCGYTVLEASRGEEALDVLAGQGDGAVDLLVTDVVLPGMSGPDVAARFPELPVLFVSGYAHRLLDDEVLAGANRRFLPKPYDPSELAREVRALLDLRADPAVSRAMRDG